MTLKKNLSELGGKRRELPQTLAIRFPHRWADGIENRRDQFRDWRYIAMQVLQRNGGPFRLISILDQVFSLNDGECWAKDEEFAREAGHCSVKTVSREIRTLRQLGLIMADPGWVMNPMGKKVKGRKLRLSLPANIGDVHLRSH